MKSGRSGYSGAFIDCFFPHEAGSGKRNLGKIAIRSMAGTDPREQEFVQVLKGLGDYVDVDDPEARRILKAVVSSYGIKAAGPPAEAESVLYRAILSVGKTLGQGACTHIVKTGALAEVAKQSRYVDHFQALADGLEE